MQVNAYRDENNRPLLIGILNSDGSSVQRVKANPIGNLLRVDEGMGGTDIGNNQGNALVDENGVAVMTALSSDGSGNIIEVYVTTNGQVLIDSY